MDFPTGQSRLVQFGFRRLTKEEIEHKNADSAENRGIIWQEAVLIRVQNRQSMFLPGTGRNGILNSHPEIVALISDMLQNMRKTGCVVNGTVARVIIVGILQSLVPFILVENGGRFKVSASWVKVPLQLKNCRIISMSKDT